MYLNSYINFRQQSSHIQDSTPKYRWVGLMLHDDGGLSGSPTLNRSLLDVNDDVLLYIVHLILSENSCRFNAIRLSPFIKCALEPSSSLGFSSPYESLRLCAISRRVRTLVSKTPTNWCWISGGMCNELILHCLNLSGDLGLHVTLVSTCMAPMYPLRAYIPEALRDTAKRWESLSVSLIISEFGHDNHSFSLDKIDLPKLKHLSISDATNNGRSKSSVIALPEWNTLSLTSLRSSLRLHSLPSSLQTYAYVLPQSLGANDFSSLPSCSLLQDLTLDFTALDFTGYLVPPDVFPVKLESLQKLTLKLAVKASPQGGNWLGVTTEMQTLCSGFSFPNVASLDVTITVDHQGGKLLPDVRKKIKRSPLNALFPSEADGECYFPSLSSLRLRVIPSQNCFQFMDLPESVKNFSFPTRLYSKLDQMSLQFVVEQNRAVEC